MHVQLLYMCQLVRWQNDFYIQLTFLKLCCHRATSKGSRVKQLDTPQSDANPVVPTLGQACDMYR